MRRHEGARAGAVAARSRLKTAKDTEIKAQRRVADLVAQHKVERGREAHHGPVAAYRIGGKRFTLLKDAAAYAKTHGIRASEIKRVALTSGEAKRVGEISKARRALKTATDRRRAAEKASRAAERGVHESPLPETQAALRYGEGSRALGFDKHPGAFLPNEDIESVPPLAWPRPGHRRLPPAPRRRRRPPRVPQAAPSRLPPD